MPDLTKLGKPFTEWGFWHFLSRLAPSSFLKVLRFPPPDPHPLNFDHQLTNPYLFNTFPLHSNDIVVMT